jgi:hypothetical protein
VGGNFGGTVGADTTFPQTMLVDYVRLYQSKPNLEQFRATFRDNFTGWKQITLPFSAFQSPQGQLPNSTKIASFGFELPDGLRGPVLLDQIRLTCANEVPVTSNTDSGAGSLRSALVNVCVGGTISFAPALLDASDDGL